MTLETGETVISLCTYSVGDPFSVEESETYHMCGRPAVKRALFAPKPESFGTINYCKRHWTIASQVIQPDVTIEDIDGD